MPVITSLGFASAPLPHDLIAQREKFLKGEAGADALAAAARDAQAQRWALQRDAGAAIVPCGDFTWDDPVAGVMRLIGVTAPLHRPPQRASWFDSGLHLSMPDLDGDPPLTLSDNAPLAQYQEARQAGFTARPVLLGPVSFLLHGRRWMEGDPLRHFDRLLPVYVEAARALAAAGAEWIQLDEPALAQPLDDATLRRLDKAVREIAGVSSRLKIFLTAPWGGLGERLAFAANLSIQALHLDLVAAPEQLEAALDVCPSHVILSLGMVSGTGVEIAAFKSEPRRAIEDAAEYLGGDRVWLAPATPLSPILEKAQLAMNYLRGLRQE